MPGAKRKCDEDTWIVTQSKKFKCGQLIANVYASTLAQLRMGARSVFNTNSKNISNDATPKSPERVGNQSPTGSSSPFHSPPASPGVRDIISDSDMAPLNNNTPKEICNNCIFKKDGWEKCYYCDSLVCHVNECQGCQDGFCNNCCIAKYDNPIGETYACYRCLH